MLNSATIVGRLTSDPSLRYTPNGVAVANFTIAVDNPFKKDDAQFIQCVAWKKQAENLANYMRKGSMVGVDGRIETRSFDNKEGQRIFVTEVVANQVAFLENKGNNNQSSNQSQQQQQQNNSQQQDPFQDNGEPIDISDDDLPF